MPDRIIRDGLLDSETVSALHDRTFRLYIHLLISADDYGLVAIEYGPIKRSAPLTDWPRELVAKMLSELADSQLILIYEVAGHRYAAIPKWRTFVRSQHPKYPIPTFGMDHVLKPSGFKDSVCRKAFMEFCPQFKDLVHERVYPGAPQGHPREDPGPPQGRMGRRVEGLRVEGKEQLPSNADALLVGTNPDPDLQVGEDQGEERTALACPHQKIIALYAKHLPGLTQPRTWEGTRAQTLTMRWRYCAKVNGASTGYRTQAEGLMYWEEYFKFVAGTKLAEGFRRPDGSFWQPDLPWLLKAENFAKIVEGKYS